ncbi:pimeloyl-ACP methyl ester carboxylesterase [Mumia flava]|uniref:Pimeloyl-ACP methyl ester carboxylesterase n=1 Tax=Mumia flava TaxID=1348852 RepID=A0A0B2B708_9ACTN|nr:alpha/beta fold hydrolase [Mumia flava]PJJ57870.1 pimeloyl-ACP methyl ester carboxylesterase [Mumia flava]
MSGIVHTRRGRGEPLVLIHGIGHRKEAWAPVIDRLAEHHDVIAVDLPGFGASAPLDEGSADGMHAYVEAMEDLFDDLGLSHPHVVGNSLGGAIALELAARGSVRTATALSPAGFWTEGGRLWAFAVLLGIRASALMPPGVIRWVGAHRWARGAAMASLHAHPTRLSQEAFLGDVAALRDCTAFGRVLRAGSRYRYRGRPRVPATIAWGTADRILLPSQAGRARQQLVDAAHVPLPGCGHVPMIDDPGLVARVVLDRSRSATPTTSERAA